LDKNCLTNCLVVSTVF